jgi:hypothetical protein
MKISQILPTGSANRPKKATIRPFSFVWRRASRHKSLPGSICAATTELAVRLRHPHLSFPRRLPAQIISNYTNRSHSFIQQKPTKSKQIKILLNKNQMMTAVCLNYH